MSSRPAPDPSHPGRLFAASIFISPEQNEEGMASENVEEIGPDRIG
ncbi:hypothetical protein [Rhizobium mongolense]|nr:hypothetical protein [Rhizobium mongolense]MBB4230572.1 hypothetical protein [Rhizobium mongolense]